MENARDYVRLTDPADPKRCELPVVLMLKNSSVLEIETSHRKHPLFIGPSVRDVTCLRDRSFLFEEPQDALSAIIGVTYERMKRLKNSLSADGALQFPLKNLCPFPDAAILPVTIDAYGDPVDWAT
jgi:hypothetical protein